MYISKFTVGGYRYKTIESLGKNFVTFVLKFFCIDSIGIMYAVFRDSGKPCKQKTALLEE